MFKEFVLEDLNLNDKRIIARLDLTKKIDYCNTNFLKLIGYEEDKDSIVKKQNFFDLLRESMPQKLINEILFHIDRNETWAGFIKIQRKQPHEQVWAFLNISPIIDSNTKSKNGYSILISRMSSKDIEEVKNKFEEND